MFNSFIKLFSSGKARGVIIGFLAGLCFIAFGWWKTLLLIGTTSFGFLIGKFYEERDLDVELEEQEFIATQTTEKIEQTETLEEQKNDGEEQK